MIAGMPIPTKNIDRVRFYVLSAADVLANSVCEVTDSRLYDANIPRANGLLDLRMGTCDPRVNCATCLHSMETCVGHPGHINLVTAVYHPYFVEDVFRLLQCVCYFCSAFLIPNALNDNRITKLLNVGKDPNTRFSTVCKLARAKKKCSVCKSPQPEWHRQGLVITRVWGGATTFFDDQQQDYAEQPFLPTVARDILANIDVEFLKLLEISHAENMILTVLYVPPPIVRPAISHGGSGSKAKGQDHLTQHLQEILKKNEALRESLRESLRETSLREDAGNTAAKQFTELQNAVANYFVNGSPHVPKTIQRSGMPLRDLTKRLKGKKGQLRNNLQGKRTDNSGRCVITPDSNLDIDEIGMPYLMAINLLFDETVNARNQAGLTRRVLQGAKQLDGARYVVKGTGGNENPTTYDLSSPGVMKHVLPLKPGDVVKRPLNNGDYVLLNRNPTLHKSGIMAFRVRILPGYTMRLNLSVTTPFNADFDGDEMTVHAVSSYAAKAELTEIMHVNKQILNPQGNRASMGLVQDALLAGFMLTGKDIFLERATYMNLMMHNTYRTKEWVLPEPAILKPKPLWTGKQLFSEFLPGRALNLTQTVRSADRATTSQFDPLERHILIRHGELLTGRLCKATLGPVANGLVHIMAKDWGMDQAAHFLSDAQRMLTYWITHNQGFSVGLNDCVIPKTVHQKVKSIIKRTFERVDLVNHEAQVNHFAAPEVEAGVSSLLQKILDYAGRAAQASLSFSNALLAMTMAGSKGTMVNLSQITAAIGLQLLEARRPPLHFVTKRSLPYFPPNTNTAESRGFLACNFYSGLNPVQLFFHAASGREGLVDSAVRTAVVGYSNRRAMKFTGSVYVGYDNTLRNAQKYVVNYRYGGADSMAPEYLERMRLGVLELDNLTIRERFGGGDNGSSTDSPDVERILRLRDQVRAIKRIPFLGNSGELDTLVSLPVNIPRVIENLRSVRAGVGIATSSSSYPTAPPEIREMVLQRLMYGLPNPTPYWQLAVAVFLAESQTADFSLEQYLELFEAIETVYMRSLIQPGEAVGALCAQSIGEPTTQITLNSFHQSGLSKTAVHLGMPRLLELWDCNTEHASATIRVRGGAPVTTSLLPKLIYTTLSDVVASYEIQRRALGTNLPDSYSEYVLILYLRRNVLEARHLGIRDLVAKFRDLFGGGGGGSSGDPSALDGWVEDFTEPNDFSPPHPYLVIRPNHFGALCRAASIIPAVQQEANRIMVDDFRSRIITEMELGGIKALKDAWVRDITSSVVVVGTGGIRNQVETIIETEGTDLTEIWQLEGVDFARTYSNKVEEIEALLGLEAAIFSCFHEMRHIFVTEGTMLDEHHFALFADVMSFRGYFVPVRRNGMIQLDTGVLDRAAFEKTMVVLQKSCLFGELDPLEDPHGGVFFGQHIPIGTGLTEAFSKHASEGPTAASRGYHSSLHRPSSLIQTICAFSEASIPVSESDFFVDPAAPVIPRQFLVTAEVPSAAPPRQHPPIRYFPPPGDAKFSSSSSSFSSQILFFPPSPDLRVSSSSSSTTQPVSRTRFRPPSPELRNAGYNADYGSFVPVHSPNYQPMSPGPYHPKSPEYSPMSPSYHPPPEDEYDPVRPGVLLPEEEYDPARPAYSDPPPTSPSYYRSESTQSDYTTPPESLSLDLAGLLAATDALFKGGTSNP